MDISHNPRDPASPNVGGFHDNFASVANPTLSVAECAVVVFVSVAGLEPKAAVAWIRLMAHIGAFGFIPNDLAFLCRVAGVRRQYLVERLWRRIATTLQVSECGQKLVLPKVKS